MRFIQSRFKMSLLFNKCGTLKWGFGLDFKNPLKEKEGQKGYYFVSDPLVLFNKPILILSQQVLICIL